MENKYKEALQIIKDELKKDEALFNNYQNRIAQAFRNSYCMVGMQNTRAMDQVSKSGARNFLYNWIREVE